MLLWGASGLAQNRMSEEDQKQAVDTISRLLKENYVFEDIGITCGKHLSERLQEGAFKGMTDAAELARAFTQELQDISHDKHMRVRPAAGRGGNDGDRPDPLLDELRMRQSMAARNFGVARAEVLDGNIGVLDIRFFPPAPLAQPTAAAAMKVLENVDALIIDLRNNSGGNPDLIQFYCSHFFDKKTHLNSLYWRKGNRTDEFWTLDTIEGKKRPDVPIFVLTSRRTFSGGEEFAYNLKTRKRAALIGETTGGGANPGGMFPVNGSLGIFIPTGRAMNPVTGTNWEGVGVMPDVPLPAAEAFEAALGKAREAAKVHMQKKQEHAEEMIGNIRGGLDQADALFKSEKKVEAAAMISQTLEEGIANDVLGEMSINVLGYDHLGSDKTDVAIEIFRFNARAFPGSSNVYDSLGEALMKAGKNEEAIVNYKKSLELDPRNDNAREMIRKMGGKL